MCGHRPQNLLILRYPQLSLNLRPNRDVRAGINLYGQHAGFLPASRQQAKGWRYYLSQNIGPAVTGSAGPCRTCSAAPAVST